MLDLTNKAERYRKEAVICHERIASPARLLTEHRRALPLHGGGCFEKGGNGRPDHLWTEPRSPTLKVEVNAKDGSAKISNCSRYGLETHALRRIKTRNSCNLDTVPEIAGDLEVCIADGHASSLSRTTSF
jgi:hypothetical protein